MTRPHERTPGTALALAGAVLFGAGMVGGNALVQLSTTGGSQLRERITAPGGYRLSAVAAAAAAVGVLLVVAAAVQVVTTTAARFVATAAAGAAGAALLLLAGLRYAAPELVDDTSGAAISPVFSALMSAGAFAAFVALGLALLAAPGPAGSVRMLGRAAGGCCLLGPLLAAVVSAADPGAGYGVALASTALAVLLVAGWGLSLAVALRA